MPNVPEDYVHRIGRTGRAGSPGEAISLVSVDENVFLRDIERLIQREIPKEIVPGFAPPAHERPEPIVLGRMVIGEGAGRGGNKPRRDPRGNEPRSGDPRGRPRAGGTASGSRQPGAADGQHGRSETAQHRGDRPRVDAAQHHGDRPRDSAPRRAGDRNNGHARLLGPKR